MLALVAHCPGRRLLLGVTPELALATPDLVAIDWSAPMIAGVWPGNAIDRSVVEADWFAMPFAANSFGAAIGDGALNMLHWPDGYRAVCESLRQVLRPGARIVIRCFITPNTPESLAELIRETLAGRVANFHGFKWRLAMAARRAGSPNIAARAIWEAFEAAFPDRTALAAATGWPLATIAEIDDYAVSTLTKSFPTRAELRQAVADAVFVESEGYDLAERCPLLVIDCA